ncbi:MAG: AI-2E family transporter [Cyanobacteria bacterium SW_9_44_58]|nr:MAG: AI-2E family transporter [Cyanobacteria bacterium SW_9_44_58]
MNAIAQWVNRLSETLPRWLVVLLIFPLILLDGWLFLGFIDYFKQLIMIFIAASLLAFLLSYPASFLENFNVKHGYAVLIVFFSTIIIATLVALFSIPFLLEQLYTLQNRIPNWTESAELQLQQLGALISLDLTDWSEQIEITLQDQLQSFIVELPNFVLGTISNFLQIFFILILTVFLAIFYKGFLESTVEVWFPETGNQVLRSLRRNFNSYIVNQFALATSLTVVMIPTFWLLNVPFYLLFAVGIGIMGLIPFGAILTIFIIGLILTLKSIWLGLKVLVVALIIDQIIENTITPRLLGTLTGLNPIVVLFSLMVKARISGYLGVLIAVPIAATIKSTLRMASQKNNTSTAITNNNFDHETTVSETGIS